MGKLLTRLFFVIFSLFFPDSFIGFVKKFHRQIPCYNWRSCWFLDSSPRNNRTLLKYINLLKRLKNFRKWRFFDIYIIDKNTFFILQIFELQIIDRKACKIMVREKNNNFIK